MFVIYKNLIVPYFICSRNPPPVYSDPYRESHKAFYKRLFRVYSSSKNISLFIERSFCRRYGCGCLFSFFSVGRNFTFRINKTVNLLRFRTPFKTVLAFIRSVATYQYFCFQLIYFRSVFQTCVNVYFTFFLTKQIPNKRTENDTRETNRRSYVPRSIRTISRHPPVDGAHVLCAYECVFRHYCTLEMHVFGRGG